MNIYLNSLNYDINTNNIFITEDGKIFLKYGLSILGSIKEIGNNIANILYYMSNCIKDIKTPRNEAIGKSESGEYMELIFFGKVVKRINMKQACYLLNERNYEKNCIDFQNDFENPSLNEINIDGVFSGEYKKIKYLLNKNQNILMISILTKQEENTEDEEPFISFSLEKDMIGRIRGTNQEEE